MLFTDAVNRHFAWTLVLWASIPLRAQTALSLADAVSRAMEAHLLLRAAAARVNVAEGLKLQAALRPNPRLFLQSENTRFSGSPGFAFGRDADSFAYAGQVLETAQKREKRAQYYSHGVHRSELERDLTAYQMAYRVSVAYWTALGASWHHSVLRAALANFERIVQYHRDRVREGAVAEADLLRVQLEYERLELSVRSADQEATRGRMLLFREMGVPDPGLVQFSEKIDSLWEVDGTEASQTLEQRADLKLLRQIRSQADANVVLQRAYRRPDPEFIAGYKRTAGFNTVLAGVQINLPLRNKNQGAIASALAEVRAADAVARAASAFAEAEIQAARATYESRLSIITNTFPPLRQKAGEGASIAQAAYMEGGTDLLRLLDSERVRIETDVLYYRALVDYQLSVVELRNALGILR